MSRFHDAMMRKQQAEAEQEGAQRPSSKSTGRVSILPLPELASAEHETRSSVRATPQPEIRVPPPPVETAAGGSAGLAEEGPRESEQAAQRSPRFDIHPAYERIIQRLLAHRRAKRENVYLVASAVAGEGASTIARNLAKAIGHDQADRVVLVDANLRTPSQHEAFGLPREEGLVDVLAGTISLTRGLATDPGTGLGVLTSGSPTESPPHLLAHSSFHSLVGALQAEYDWVILDGPPVTTYPDAASLAQAAGGAVLVLRAEHTRWEVADEARHVLENSGTDILGAVLNRRKYHIPNFIYRRL